MRFARRLITVIVGCGAWCLAAATVAYAKLPADGSAVSGDNTVVPVPTSAATPVWEFVAIAALGALLTLAVLGLVFSRRGSRRPEPRLHA